MKKFIKEMYSGDAGSPHLVSVFIGAFLMALIACIIQLISGDGDARLSLLLMMTGFFFLNNFIVLGAWYLVDMYIPYDWKHYDKIETLSIFLILPLLPIWCINQMIASKVDEYINI